MQSIILWPNTDAGSDLYQGLLEFGEKITN